MRRLVMVSILLVALWGVARASQTTPTEPSEPVRKLMSLKMDYMQSILQSMIVRDFESTQKYSFRMSVLMGAADWRVIRTEEYNRHTDELENAVAELREASKESDLDRATLAYTAAMLKCVQCHEYVGRFQTESER
jgi:hypothetical protein